MSMPNLNRSNVLLDMQNVEELSGTSKGYKMKETNCLFFLFFTAEEGRPTAAANGSVERKEESTPKAVRLAVPVPDPTVDDDSVYSDDVSDAEPFRARIGSLHESRCYSPRQVEETSLPATDQTKPAKRSQREQLLQKAKELDQLQENLLETLNQLKGSNPQVASRLASGVTPTNAAHMKASIDRVEVGCCALTCWLILFVSLLTEHLVLQPIFSL